MDILLNNWNKMTTLKKRILTAVILIPIVLGSLLMLNPEGFAIATSVVILLGAWEWAGLFGYSKTYHRALYTFFILLLIILYAFSPQSLMLMIALSAWGLALFWICYYPKSARVWNHWWMVAFMGTQYLVPCWLGLQFVRANPQGQWWVLFLLVLLWSADTTAFFVGKKFGKDKLALKVSPGKTWQGVYGAMLSGLLLAIASGWWLSLHWSKWVGWILLCVVTVLISIVGDLTISMFKREQNLKDSGTILPGHGGLLDRIDSLLAASPLFAVGLLSMGFNGL